MGKRPTFGNIVEQCDEELRLALVVTRDHAIARKNALARASLDGEFVTVLTFGRVERRAVRRHDACRRLGSEDLVGALAHDIIARIAREALKGAVGEYIAAILDVLGGHAYRHILEHRFQELLG
ncbi:hypothetical protein GALL_507840 [mine drainage metagenome]|uniref:Uncharacterized protein n=1 Tax=mine drainage metagenome TaxID=410659 RepID=A0A1J5PQS1_9ZZZZ